MRHLVPRALAILVAVLLGCACSRVEDERAAYEEARAERHDARDYLAGIERAHRETDAAIAAGDTERAIGLLRAAFETPVPPSMATEDARALRQDLAFRLSELELGASDPSSAIAWADRGLALGEAEDVFTANLRIVRGRAREAAGDDREAVSDYFRALEINEALLRRTLDGTPPEGP